MRFRRFFAMAASLAVIASGLALPVARAQQAQRPVAIVSISPLDRLLQDTSYLLKACNVPEVGGLVSIMANQYTQGVDKSKPIGVSISLEGPMPSAVIFLPISDRQKFFGALAGMGIEPDDLGDGMFEIDANGQTIYAKDSSGWLFIAQSEEALANVPADPAKLLGALPQQYDVAVNLDLQALPPEMKQMAIDQMRIGLERGMAEQRGLSAEELAKAKELSAANIKQLEQLINDTDKVIIGWNVEAPKQQVHFDLAAQFISGSKSAGQLALMQNLKSDFTQLPAPGSAVHFRFTSKIAEADKAAQIMNLRNSMSQAAQQIPEKDRPMAKQILDGLTKVMEATIQEGTFDGAGSVSLDDDTFRAVLGGKVADGRALEAELKRVADAVSGKPSAPEFKFNTGTHQGMTLHSVRFPIKSDDRTVQKAFGDAILLSVATADDAFMISVDPTGDTALKAAIDRMGSAKAQGVTPMDATLEVAQIIRYAQALAPNPLLDNALQTVQQYVGKDKVQLAARMIERGAMYRITIEEGVLRSAGAAAKGGNNANGGF